MRSWGGLVHVVGVGEPAVAVGLGDLGGEIDHVCALVAAVGEVGVAAVGLAVAGEEGLAEESDLSAGVVDVILALDLAAGGGENGGEGVAEHGAASVADLERTGGIGGDEFDLDAGAVAVIAGAPLGAGCDDVVEAGAFPVGVQGEVEEAGAGDLDVGDGFAAGDAGGDLFGDVDGGAAHG